jgi:hypothetical protein
MRYDIFTAISAERVRQRVKWQSPHPWGTGDCSSAFVTAPVKMAVLAEECGEVARAMLDGKTEELRAELIQVAAVAVAWLEGMDA